MLEGSLQLPRFCRSHSSDCICRIFNFTARHIVRPACAIGHGPPRRAGTNLIRGWASQGRAAGRGGRGVDP